MLCNQMQHKFACAKREGNIQYKNKSKGLVLLKQNTYQTNKEWQGVVIEKPREK